MSFTRVCLLFVVAICGSCATTGGSKADSQKSKIPTQAELEVLLATPVDEKTSFPAKREPVAPWTFEGPQPEFLGTVPVTASNPIEELLDSRDYGQLTTAAHCVARELGRYVVSHEARPPVSLIQYTRQWCGAVSTGISTMWGTYKGATPAEVATQVTDRASFLSAGQENVELGGWIDPEREFGLIVAFDREVDLEPIPLVSDARVFTLKGKVRPEIRDRLETVGASVTMGPYSATTCNADPTIAFPDFSIQCTAPDQTTFVSLSAGLKASRRIGTTLMTAAQFRIPPGLQYSPPPVPSPAPNTNSEFVPSLLAAINEIRAQAGFEPMELSPAQSAVVGELRPRIDEALGRRDYKLGDRLVAGMTAGWEIDADIVGGNWTLRRVRRTHIADVLTYLWQSAGRRILFGEAARFAAIHWDENGRLTLATYNTLAQEHYNRRVARVFRRVNELRAAYGRPKVRRMGKLNSEIKEICDKVTAGKLTVEQGFQRFSALSTQIPGKTWRTYREVSDLSDVSVAPRLINRRNLEVGVGVAVAREPGSPFAHYVVYFFWPD